jgi:type II secretory pathway pseudopilin PulG
MPFEHRYPRTGRARRAAAAGFSVVEALIAAAILLIIAIGVLPLFTRAIMDNQAGNDSSTVTNFARSQVEDRFQLNFNDANLTLPVSGATELATTDSWAQGVPNEIADNTEGWYAGAPTDKGPLLWTRTTTIRQYNVNDLDDNGQFDTPLAGTTDPGQVHLKEIEVNLVGQRLGGPLGASKQIRLRTLKSQ